MHVWSLISLSVECKILKLEMAFMSHLYQAMCTKRLGHKASELKCTIEGINYKEYLNPSFLHEVVDFKSSGSNWSHNHHLKRRKMVSAQWIN